MQGCSQYDGEGKWPRQQHFARAAGIQACIAALLQLTYEEKILSAQAAECGCSELPSTPLKHEVLPPRLLVTLDPRTSTSHSDKSPLEAARTNTWKRHAPPQVWIRSNTLAQHMMTKYEQGLRRTPNATLTIHHIWLPHYFLSWLLSIAFHFHPLNYSREKTNEEKPIWKSSLSPCIVPKTPNCFYMAVRGRKSQLA